MNAITPNILSDTSADVLGALRETAMLAACRISRFGLERKDKTTSEEVRVQKGVAERGLRVTVNRLAGADEHHRAIVSLQEEIRDAFNRWTFYWDEGGWRGLPTAAFNDMLREIAPRDAAFKARLLEYETALPEVMERARIGLGTANIELPAPEEIIAAYGVKLEFQPIPDRASFRGLPQTTQAKLSEHLVTRAAKARTEAVQDVLGRVAPVLSRMVERLNAFDARQAKMAEGIDPGKEGIFRDSLVENVKDIAQVLPSFNVLGDPTLDAAIAQITALAGGLTPEKLRQDDALRAGVKQQAKDTLDMLAMYRGVTPCPYA